MSFDFGSYTNTTNSNGHVESIIGELMTSLINNGTTTSVFLKKHSDPIYGITISPNNATNNELVTGVLDVAHGPVSNAACSSGSELSIRRQLTCYSSLCTQVAHPIFAIRTSQLPLPKMAEDRLVENVKNAY